MFSVIIPTYNRGDVLCKTLNAYLKQTSFNLIKEIIVIDDGSTDNTRCVVENLINTFPIPVMYLYQENKGPAEARNRGIRAASGKMLLISGDDIAPHPHLIEEHLLYHQKNDFVNNVAVLGKTIFPPREHVTPFMEYIQENGLQFGYPLIENENDVPFNFFYTSNISIHRDFLLEDNNLFDTEFPYAAWEDIELAYRLKQKSLKIVYNKNAIGYHHHKISFASFRKRQELCGYSACIFYKKHPELEDFLKINLSKYNSTLSKIMIKLIEVFCLFADKYLPITFPHAYDQVMDYYYHKGINLYNSIKTKQRQSHENNEVGKGYR